MKVITRVETITPDVAKVYLKFNKSNRPVIQSVVDKYARQMLDGEWKLNGEAICFSDGGILLNGQHRLLAVIKANTSIESVVVRGCDSDSFITYDSGRTRKASDIFALEEIPNYTNISSVVQKYFRLKNYQTIMASNRTKGNNKTTASKKQLLDEYYTSPELYQNTLAAIKKWNSGYNIVSHTEIAATAIYLQKVMNHPQDTVMKFFEMLLTGKDITDIVFILRNYYIKDKLSKSPAIAKTRQIALIKTWNAYIKGKTWTRLMITERDYNLWFI